MCNSHVFSFIVCNYNNLCQESIEVLMPLKLQHKERPAWEGKLSAILTCDMMTYFWRGWSQSEMTLRQSPTWRCSSERQQDSDEIFDVWSEPDNGFFYQTLPGAKWNAKRSAGGTGRDGAKVLFYPTVEAGGVQHINFATCWFLDSEFTLAWSSAKEWI